MVNFYHTLFFDTFQTVEKKARAIVVSKGNKEVVEAVILSRLRDYRRGHWRIEAILINDETINENSIDEMYVNITIGILENKRSLNVD